MQPVFLLKDATKLDNYHETSAYFLKNSPALRRDFKPADTVTIYLGMSKSQRTFCFIAFVLGFAPLSSYSICGSSAKKQRGDEQYACAVEAALRAIAEDAPAYVPQSALPPTARTRKPVCEDPFV